MKKEYIYSFPRMGYSYIGFKAFFEAMDKKVIIPPPRNQEVLELGVRYSPEDMCFPFKILLGQYIKVLEEGANILISLGGYGPCRFGYYMPLHEEILRDLGYKFKTITIEPPIAPWNIGIPKFFHMLYDLLGFNSPFKLYNAGRNAVYKMLYVEQLEKKMHYLIPREVRKGETEKIFEKALDILDKSGGKNFNKIKDAFNEAKALMDNIEHIKNDNLIKIGIVGEIYMVLDHDNNLDIEKKLINMGVDIDRSLWVSSWTLHRVIYRKKHREHMMNLIKPYLGEFIGGDGQESIMNTILYKQKGYDGVIHILPFGCLPEISAKEILTNVSHDYDIPVLSLSFDEQTGEAGFVTRLEAFIDLLLQRRGEGLNEIVSGY